MPVCPFVTVESLVTSAARRLACNKTFAVTPANRDGDCDAVALVTVLQSGRGCDRQLRVTASFLGMYQVY
jgi:hypothetical protein